MKGNRCFWSHVLTRLFMPAYALSVGFYTKLVESADSHTTTKISKSCLTINIPTAQIHYHNKTLLR